MESIDQLTAARIEVEDSLEAVNDLFARKGWGDGLPMVPPTPERVLSMLQGSGRDPQEVLGAIPPNWADATVEKIAINAVMAGCKPEYLPVLLAAVEAIAVKEFNLYGIQATTSSVTPMIIVNGPIAREVGINGGPNALGQGWRANATIGRAIRLVMLNVGGARPGILDKSTHGQPGKYTMVIAENEQASPWQPFHTGRGFTKEQNVVTAVGPIGTVPIFDLATTSAEGFLTTVAHSMNGIGHHNMLLGGEPLVLLSPEHADLVANDGFSKEDVQAFLFEHSQVPLTAFHREYYQQIYEWRRDRLSEIDESRTISVAERPEDIQVVVAGGPGPHSVFVPTFGDMLAISKLIK